ncbi:MAG: oxidoreductase [Microscillaceae bacterium]|nr:oxidoreductase [Microscillaceae bacterium]
MSLQTYFLKVKEIVPETTEAITLVFDHPETGKMAYQAGQFLTLLLNIEQQSVRRAYSLCTSPTTDEYPAITVKKVEKGLVSNYLHQTLRPGSVLEVLPPMGQFTTAFDAQQTRHLILLAGGSGITPLMAILKAALAEEPQSQVSLLYANRDPQSIIFKEALEKFQTQYPERFRVVHLLEKAPLFWNKGHKGRISTKLLKKILDSWPSFDSTHTEYYMCGPGGMMQQITQSFTELGLPLDNLRKESFGVSPEEAAQKAAAVLPAATLSALPAYTVLVKYAGEEYTFDVPPRQNYPANRP